MALWLMALRELIGEVHGGRIGKETAEW